MKNDSNEALPKDAQPSESLTRVLDQSEEVKELVAEAAEELSTVNTVLKQELTEQTPQPAIEDAIEKNAAVEDKVQEASEKLAVVNRALKAEVKERNLLETELAAVTEQGEAARQVLATQLAAATEQGEADRHAAFHDALTGLPNRALFTDRLEHGIAQATRHGWALAVMFIDLDDFKIINDTLGHDAGDSVLRTIALRLKDATRSDDTLSRFGGDEFLYLLMEVRDEQDVTSIAEKMVKSIAAPCEVSVHGLTTSQSVKASIGIAVFPRHGATAGQLIKSADTAMYAAKRAKSGFSFAR